VFPTNDSVTRPLPSLLTGFLGFGFPAFHRYYEEAKTSRVPPTRSVAVACRYRSCALGFRSRGSQRPPPWAWDLVSRMSRPAMGAEIDGISQVPREPRCAFALLSDPGRIDSTKPVQWVDVAPVPTTTKAPCDLALFRGSMTRLLHSLSTLRAAMADDDARLASGRWLTLTGWDWIPTGFRWEVSRFDGLSSSPRLAWRNIGSATFGHSRQLPHAFAGA